MGGIWYLNNVGIINIGSLLTRLGIQIFTGNGNNNQNNVQPPPITLPTTSNESEIGRGFFRQLGQKVLTLLDVFIENLKNKKQKYK